MADPDVGLPRSANESLRQQELVRIRQLDTSPVPTMVGSALNLMVDAFGTLEQRCSTMETELGDERAQRLEAERLAAEAAAASKQALEKALADERRRAEAERKLLEELERQRAENVRLRREAEVAEIRRHQQQELRRNSGGLRPLHVLNPTLNRHQQPPMQRHLP